jgi:uncharacterized protein YggE
MSSRKTCDRSRSLIKENYSNHGKIIGYAVMRPFEIKLHDINAFPKLVDDLIAMGGIEPSGINGGLEKENEIQNEIWDKAAANARNQADKTLKPMNMRIDSIFAISPVPIPEISSTIFPKDRAGAAEKVIVTASNIPTAEEVGPSQYRVPPVSVTQIVHVIYLISPAK